MENAEKSMDSQKKVLHAFSQALDREAHVLTHRPDLLWQQLHNELYPLKESGVRLLLEREANRRRSEHWLKRRGGSAASPMKVLVSLASGIESCDRSAAPGLLGIGCRDGTVHILNPATGEEFTIGKHEGSVSCCRFTPDGLHLISGGKDSTLRVYHVETRQHLGVFRGHQSPVTCLAILPNKNHAISGSQDRTLTIWDIYTLETVKILRNHDRGVLCCSLSADGSLLASGDTGGRLVLWDMRSFEPVGSFTAHDDAILGCALSHNGDLLVTSAADETARVWQLKGDNPPIELIGHTDEVAACGFAGDDRLVTVGADQSIRSWNRKTGEAVAAAHSHGGPITCLSIQMEKTIAYTGATNGSVIAWNIADLGDETAPAGHNAAITSAVVSPRGDIATSSLDGTAIIWRTSDGHVQRQLRCDEPLTGCAMRQGGVAIVTSGSRKPIIEWDVSSGAQLRTMPIGSEIVMCCAADPDRGPLVLGTMAGLTVVESDNRFWKLNLQMDSSYLADRARLKEMEQYHSLPGGISKQEIRELSRDHESMMLPGVEYGSAQCVAVQPGGRLAAVGDVIGRVTLVDLLTRSISRVLPAPSNATNLSTRSVALSSDHLRVAVGYSDGTVSIYSMEGEPLVYWRQDSCVLVCAFSSNAQLLAVGTDGKHLSVWKWHECKEIYHLPMTHNVQACAFSKDEPLLVCGDAGGDVWLVEMIGSENSNNQNQ